MLITDRAVLPPVPTTGLTADDIPDLIEKVRGQMLAALIEISQPPPKSVIESKTPSPEPEEPLVVQDDDSKIGKLIETVDEVADVGADTTSTAALSKPEPVENGVGKVALA